MVLNCLRRKWLYIIYKYYLSSRSNDCWLIIFINMNLPPTERYLKNNIFICGLLPGPKCPKDMNSFLYPMVTELKMLESIFHT